MRVKRNKSAFAAPCRPRLPPRYSDSLRLGSPSFARYSSPITTDDGRSFCSEAGAELGSAPMAMSSLKFTEIKNLFGFQEGHQFLTLYGYFIPQPILADLRRGLGPAAIGLRRRQVMVQHIYAHKILLALAPGTSTKKQKKSKKKQNKSKIKAK